MAKETNRTYTAKRGTLIALVMFLLVAVIAGTYARYSNEGKATGKIQGAKWAVKIKNGDTVLNSTTQNIDFTVQDNENVVPGRIAPGVTAVAELELDLTGTEVAVDFDAVIDDSAFASFGASSDKLSLTVTVDDKTYTSGTTQTISLDDIAANSKKKVTLTLTWENDDANNADDTATGEDPKELAIPVTLTAKQHID